MKKAAEWDWIAFEKTSGRKKNWGVGGRGGAVRFLTFSEPECYVN